MKAHCEHLYIHRFDNLDEIVHFLERYSFTQEEIENLNKPLDIKDVEPKKNNLSKQEAP